MTTTYGYTRVSSRGQATDGNSLQSQSNALVQNGVKPSNIFSDIYTGKTTDRPQFNRLLDTVQPHDTIVVTALDRLARSTVEGLNLVQSLHGQNVTIRILNMGTIDNSPMGRLILTCLLGFAEFERNIIRERTAAGREIARQRPGYREGRRPKLDLADPETRQRIADAVCEHNTSTRPRLTAAEAADRLGVSRRQFYNYMKDMKDMKEADVA
jgi:DNA invertase Pin-like site-specific DNA recombinase